MSDSAHLYFLDRLHNRHSFTRRTTGVFTPHVCTLHTSFQRSSHCEQAPVELGAVRSVQSLCRVLAKTRQYLGGRMPRLAGQLLGQLSDNCWPSHAGDCSTAVRGSLAWMVHRFRVARVSRSRSPSGNLSMVHAAYDDMIRRAARSFASLAPAVSGLDQLSTELEDVRRAAARGYFTPDEDERVRARFAQYLTARAALLQTIDELKPFAITSEARPIADHTQLRAFAIAYASAALLVRAGRFIVHRFASDSLVQRKLNEAEPRFGIPPKQYTSIYKSLTDPLNGWRLLHASQFATNRQSEIDELSRDPEFAPVVVHLREAEHALRLSKRRFVLARLRYRWHSLRRRRASAYSKAMFGIFELCGRIIADVRNPFHAKRISPEVRAQLIDLLHPGDVLVTRHDDAASNLFLPGYWIHAALHIGTAGDREALGIEVDGDRRTRWSDPIRVLEAKKDGVRLRPLEETLQVDALAILRPMLSREHIAQAISRALAHEGKLYDFEFDFFRSDRLVCTEVVYRGYHGVGGLEFALSRRAGRPTLSAEDLIAMALQRKGFEPVAVFGADGCADRIADSIDAMAILSRTASHVQMEAPVAPVG